MLKRLFSGVKKTSKKHFFSYWVVKECQTLTLSLKVKKKPKTLSDNMVSTHKYLGLS